MIRTVLLLACTLGVLSVAAEAQPEVLDPDLTVSFVLTTPGTPVRLAHDATTDDLYLLTFAGDLYRIAPPYDSSTVVLVASLEEHGAPFPVYGLAVGPEGTLYLVGNARTDSTTSGVIRRGVRVGNGRAWSTVMQTELYARSGTPYDHLFNGLAVSPDGATLYVNSGSRTDHGEIQALGGLYPELREVPLSSAIVRIPTAADSLVLPNDEAALLAGGYLYADGLRNSFDLAFDADGALFATENSGARDDSDELNWIREGLHYGFPWRMGLNNTPQRFPDYDPDLDPLVNPASFAYQNGFFYNDPTYPPPPAGVSFTDPIYNTGPDADLYRDSTTGAIHDASVTGEPSATFTPHRSPLGLTFDVSASLPAPYTEDGFVLSWTNGTGDPLLGPFGDPGQDLLHLELDSAADTTRATRLVRGFANPVDAVLIGRTLYVVEFGAPNGLWVVTFPEGSSVEPGEPDAAFHLDVSPNPMRLTGVLSVRVHRPQPLRIEIVDPLGRRVALLTEGVRSPGLHTFPLDGRDWAPGVYFVRAIGEQQARTRAFTLLR